MLSNRPMLDTSCFPAVGLKPTCVSTSTTPGLACRRMSFRESSKHSSGSIQTGPTAWASACSSSDGPSNCSVIASRSALRSAAARDFQYWRRRSYDKRAAEEHERALRVQKVRPFPIGDRHDKIPDDPNPSQYISCQRQAGCCCNGNAPAHSRRLGVGGGRSSSRRGIPKRQWLLSLQDRRLPCHCDLGWPWATSDQADPRYERL